MKPIRSGVSGLDGLLLILTGIFTYLVSKENVSLTIVYGPHVLGEKASFLENLKSHWRLI